MGYLAFKICLLFFNFLLFLSCGIKKEPSPPPVPKFKIHRIGSHVYVIPLSKEIVLEGFRSVDGYYIKETPSRFCFIVKHIRGRELLQCVEEARSQKISSRILIKEDEVILKFDEEGTYRVYPYKKMLVPKILKEVRGNVIRFKREYKEKIFAITKVINSVESEPLIVKVPPRALPRPPKPEKVSYAVRENNLFIYWWLDNDEDVVGFLIYRDGELLTEKAQGSNVYVDRLPRKKTVYEIFSVNRFGIKSEPAVLIYSP